MTDHADYRAIDGVADFLGMRFPAHGVTEIDLREEFMNRAGLVSGGVVFSLLDYAMATALWEYIDETEMIATTNISINYLRSARAGTVTATSKLDRRNSRNASLRAEVRDAASELLATAVGSFAIFPVR